ncbi:MAG: UDP-N-acetylmuramoyl-L-alanine--D-glutamate ligase [Desulfarculus sp.]|nr:UDP-N-acetylmuramoyl-L-alanine--D-glutamate ligase [Desulfarculus sp.]
MDLKGQKVLVVGLGKSGAAAARLCLLRGALVTATDTAPAPAGAAGLAEMGARLSLGGHSQEDFASAGVIVLSPGVDHRLPEIQQAQARGALVMGELELGYRFLQAPAVMITGTNGKTTVTTLVGLMLEAAGLKVFSGGNLGTPLCELVAGPQDLDWAVLEVSSFQTDTAHELRPRVAVILNITPDHLDRYGSFDDYARSKYRLLAKQAENDVAILCADDPQVASRLHLAPARVWPYGAAGPRRPGGWLAGDGLMLNLDGPDDLGLGAAKSKLVGGFNRLNLLAASLASCACGAPPTAVQAVIDGFGGLGHRVQWVASIAGVDYYDDSKGTNVGAVQAALTALMRPTVLLLGGRDKEGRFADLKPQLATVTTALCFGEAGPSIHGQIKGLVNSEVVGDLPAAVRRAKALAAPGQAVLLSPGCASFDAYTGYAQRGGHFQALVREEAPRG